MLDYIGSQTRCRSQLLVAYFGQSNAKRCGSCDICTKRNLVELNELEFDRVVHLIKPLLRNTSLSLPELANQVPSVAEEHLIKVIQWLLDSRKISYVDGANLKWN